MKILLIILALFTLATPSNAGIIGWLTSERVDWHFVQRTGGIRIGVPIDREGRRVLPVEYDVSGLTTVTCKPISHNSGLAVRMIEAEKKDGQIVLRIFTQVVEKTSITGSQHYADLSEIPVGSYEVFYEIAGDKEKRLGLIEIKEGS